jgi:hypothetical protein
MRYLVFIGAVSLSFLPVASRAQLNKIELYTDAARTSCELNDQGTAVRTIYMFETGPNKSTGVRFSTPAPCWLGVTWVGCASSYTTLGNPRIDISVAYGLCLQPPILIAQAVYLSTGAAAPCCDVAVMPPAGTGIIHTNCLFGEDPAVAGQKVVINPNASCMCAGPVAVEPSTWGRVKSLYR